nr:glycosyltransferase family 4 protein [Pontibacter sp. E15-1]
MPHLRQLAALEQVRRIVLVTLERKGVPAPTIGLTAQLPDKVVHQPIYPRDYKLNLLSKIFDFMVLPGQLKKLVQYEKADHIVAVGTLAGALVHLTAIPLKIPYLVSFYEPHAAYMQENKVWKTYDPRYVFQKKWEKEQALAAQGLLVVSDAFKRELMRRYTLPAEKVVVLRNAVDEAMFYYSKEVRRVFSNATVGIYVGKYGGLYYAHEAFQIYRRCFEVIPNFRLIILSPQPQEEILQYLVACAIDVEKVHVASVTHAEVPAYLSAADFAFATIKSYPSARYCSPVKIGEYWANGLPVLLTEGVGDDSDIIHREGGGATFNLKEEGSLDRALLKILQIIQDPAHRQQIPELARKYRSSERIREAYAYFFGQSGEELP